MNRHAKIAAAAIVLTCSAAFAEARQVLLSTKVEQSDLIAQVEVLSTTQGAPASRDLKPGEYRSQAQVRVLRSIKGLQAGEVYTLDFDNGFACPNVWYKQGEKCLVFNTKSPNGHYETFNTYYGKYTIEDSKVAGWKLNSKQATPLDDVAAEITTLMQEPKEAK